MPAKEFLDLLRIDVLAAPDDHILEASFHPAIAPFVHRAEIAGVQPAVGIDRLSCLLWHLEVARHHLIAAHAQLSDGAGRDDGSCRRLDDLDLGVGQRLADGLCLVLRCIRGLGLGDDPAGFGLPVDDPGVDAERLLETPLAESSRIWTCGVGPGSPIWPSGHR